MTEANQLRNTPFDESRGALRLPSRLNTLTILTFIGCGIQLLGTLWGYINSKSGYDKLIQLQESGDIDKVPSFMRGMVGPEAVEMARKAYESRVPLLILGLVAAGLCLYGALQMRGLKKQGFVIYVIGELLPFVTSLIFIGSGSFSPWSMIGVVIALVFIYLYYTQLKFMQ
jgi:hypothetical protein